MRELIARLRDWIRRDQLDAELSDELRFHSEMLSRDARSSGAAPGDARYVARRQLGNLTRRFAKRRAIVGRSRGSIIFSRTRAMRCAASVGIQGSRPRS